MKLDISWNGANLEENLNDRRSQQEPCHTLVPSDPQDLTTAPKINEATVGSSSSPKLLDHIDGSYMVYIWFIWLYMVYMVYIWFIWFIYG